MEDIMPKVLVWIIARLEEPSTWAGGGLIAMGLKASGLVSDELVVHILAAGAAIGGLLAIILPEKSLNPVPTPVPAPNPVEKVVPIKPVPKKK